MAKRFGDAVRSRWVQLRQQDRPVKTLCALAMTVSGISIIIGETYNTSVGEVLPEWLTVIWAGLLALAGIEILLGLTSHNPLRRVVYETSGSIIGGTSYVAYALTLLINHTWHSAQVAAPLAFAVGLGFTLRSFQLVVAWNREVRRHDDDIGG